MTRHLPLILLGLASSPLTACDDEDEDSSSASACAALEGAEIELEDAKLYIEWNATDGDIGVHGLFDDSGWSELCVFAPDGELFLHVAPQSALKDLTMAGIFFESREPPEEEFDYADLQAAFAVGGYAVLGQSWDGKVYSGEASFTHDLPMPPVISYPPLVEDFEEEEPPVVSAEDLVVEWEPVTETLAGGAPTISGYEVIVTDEEYEDDDGLSKPIYDVHVGADASSLTIAAEFIQPETLYELEVLALETSGNQTITVGFFETE